MRDPLLPARGGAGCASRAVLLTAALTVVISALPAPAVAEEARAAPAAGPSQEHQEGRRKFAAGQYEAAIDAYRRAYELRADPSYLLDIAECYRALDVPERAVLFYRRYLSTHPNPPNRPEVEQTLAGLEARLPPPPVAAPAMNRPLLPPPPGGPLASGMAVTAGSRAVVADRPSILKRWWFWTAVGTLAAGAATLAIVAAGQQGDPIPSSTLGNKKLF